MSKQNKGLATDLPRKASAEEFLPWVREVRIVRQEIKKHVQKPVDFFNYYYQTGRNQFIVNPIARKAFISYLIETFGLSDPRLEADMIDPIRVIEDRPVDYLDEILAPYKKESMKPVISNMQAQRTRDIDRLEKTMKVAVEKLTEEFQENDEAWKYLLKTVIAKQTGIDEVSELLFEALLRNPLYFNQQLEALSLQSEGLQTFMATDRVFSLRSRCFSLRKKLELVREGFLVNPTL